MNDWSLSGVWSGRTGTGYDTTFSYQSGGGNLALTGSPDYAARVILRPGVDLGGGCSSDPLRQFNTGAFQGPLPNSDGLESSNGYLKGCFLQTTDLSIARTIRLGGVPHAAVPPRHVQRVQPRGDHGPSDVDELEQPDRPGADSEPAVQPGRHR